MRRQTRFFTVIAATAWISSAMAQPTATLKVLHSFKGGQDGGAPQDTLILDASGNLYGTTYYGGGRGCPNPSEKSRGVMALILLGHKIQGS